MVDDEVTGKSNSIQIPCNNISLTSRKTKKNNESPREEFQLDQKNDHSNHDFLHLESTESWVKILKCQD